MDNFRLPLEHFTHMKQMPQLLDSELSALWLLRPEEHTTRHVVWAPRSDPFIYIKRHFRSGNVSESYVLLDGELADTLRLLTSGEAGDQQIRSLNRVGAERYDELINDAVQEVATPALRNVGIRGPYSVPGVVLAASVAALAMPHKQVMYLQAPAQLRLVDERGKDWYVELTGEVVNPPEAVRS
jgi:hypothetical protein